MIDSTGNVFAMELFMEPRLQFLHKIDSIRCFKKLFKLYGCRSRTDLECNDNTQSNPNSEVENFLNDDMQTSYLFSIASSPFLIVTDSVGILDRSCKRRSQLPFKCILIDLWSGQLKIWTNGIKL